MEINQFNKLTIKMDAFIKIRFINGNTLNGSYKGNFDSISLEFNISNHATGSVDKVCLDDINVIERML
ncbi:MAG: hypothetical protein NWS46_11375 [Cyclobacteriaceae bacterium]|jgi:hypothetical protein|nr:hypothetical protein [Cyclobacteriaceae bacterium]